MKEVLRFIKENKKECSIIALIWSSAILVPVLWNIAPYLVNLMLGIIVVVLLVRYVSKG